MTLLSFGKYSTGAVQRDINEMPSDYLHWLMETDWFEDKFPEHHEEVESADIETARVEKMSTNIIAIISAAPGRFL